MLLAVVWSRLPTKCLAKFLFHTSPTLEAFTGWLEALTSFLAAANPPDSSRYRIITTQAIFIKLM